MGLSVLPVRPSIAGRLVTGRSGRQDLLVWDTPRPRRHWSARCWGSLLHPRPGKGQRDHDECPARQARAKDGP